MTYYEVLGVAPTATPEALRRAYLRQVRLWHPDLPNGDLERMRAINEAWNTLSNPLLRGAYDRELARRLRQVAQHTAAKGAASAARQPSWVKKPQNSPKAKTQSQPQARPQPAPQPMELVGIGWRWIGVVASVLVAVAVAVIVIATSNIDNSDPSNLVQVSAPVSQAEPEPGDCFLKEIAVLVPVSCEDPNDGQLVRWISLGAPCPPDTDLHWVRSSQRAVCYLPSDTSS